MARQPGHRLAFCPMTRSSSLGRSLFVAAALLSVALSACDTAGWGVRGVNETDHDVVVRFDGSQRNLVSVRLPAHSWGTIDWSRGGEPRSDWTVTIWDGDCRELGARPFTASNLEVRIRAGDEISVGELRTQASPEDLDRVELFEQAECP